MLVSSPEVMECHRCDGVLSSMRASILVGAEVRRKIHTVRLFLNIKVNMDQSEVNLNHIG